MGLIKSIGAWCLTLVLALTAAVTAEEVRAIDEMKAFHYRDILLPHLQRYVETFARVRPSLAVTIW